VPIRLLDFIPVGVEDKIDVCFGVVIRINFEGEESHGMQGHTLLIVGNIKSAVR
jgi:hypothetical protein